MECHHALGCAIPFELIALHSVAAAAERAARICAEIPTVSCTQRTAMQRPDQRRRCTASRGSSYLAAIFAVLVAGCSRAPMCDAFLVPVGASTGMSTASTLVQQVL